MGSSRATKTTTRRLAGENEPTLRWGLDLPPAAHELTKHPLPLRLQVPLVQALYTLPLSSNGAFRGSRRAAHARSPPRVSQSFWQTLFFSAPRVGGKPDRWCSDHCVSLRKKGFFSAVTHEHHTERTTRRLVSRRRQRVVCRRGNGDTHFRVPLAMSKISVKHQFERNKLKLTFPLKPFLLGNLTEHVRRRWFQR